MKLTLPLIALLLAPLAVQAATTEIAQQPLLNVSGTGLVKPNLMIIYDNSGSMVSNFTPDYVDDATSCRTSALMSSGTQACLVGHPPFTSSDFNKQYYNPAIVYAPPVKSDRSLYPSMTRAATANWTAVTTDGFNVNDTTLRNATNVPTSNLATGFPDLKWCNGGTCVFNTATYTYPDNTYQSASNYDTNAYYYTINVAEWCTTANLTTCTTTAVGAPAPAGSPFPAKVRWCNSTALTTCQAKYVGAYKYPRFSNPNGGLIAAYGTLTINASASTSSQTVTSIKVTELAGPVTITNATVTAPSGVNSGAKQAALANALAASIIAKTGLTNQYTACTRTPIAGVPSCASFGITLATDYIVAIVPIDCVAGAPNKNLGNCSVLADSTRAGWAIVGASATIGMPTTPLSAGNAVFVRTDIVPSRTSYPKSVDRLDCAAAAFCSYDEEMTNFANWYAYYKTRNQMMKTAVGLAFDSVTPSFKVGLVSLSVAAAEQPMVPPAVFSGAVRDSWYSRLYAMSSSGSTPLRQALNAVGKMYANRAPYVAAAGSEVVKYPCEQNFTFMTTDGYWNGPAAGSVTSNDEVASTTRFCSLSSGCVDPAAQSDNSLADIALYWYNGGFNTYTAGTNSLRPSLEDWSKPGLVSGGNNDNRRLHMNTYTLGLGVDGIMTYDPLYDKNPAPASDFYKLINRVTSGCPWNGGGAYVWPDPQTNQTSGSLALQTRVDDLWHAAVNGHGKYFSAASPDEVINGVRDALENIASQVGAAAAAATSTPNISQEDNDIFSDTFTTVKWYGELSDKKIDTVTGEVMTTPVWITSDTLGARVSASNDTRIIKMFNTAAGGLKDFKYSTMTALEQGWFDDKCDLLPQCTSLSPAQKIILNTGDNVVDWLRGQQQHGDDVVMRSYSLTDHNPPGMAAPIPIVLGDIASSKPAFMREPRKEYSLAGYNAFVVANKARTATVFAAANDGMLHAFRASTGEELWAYVPRITMGKLFKQVSTRYGTNHQYSTDGSPEVVDVQIAGVWKTILVAGLNGGGRGYYALDVTDPTLPPKPLWEVCADATVCTGTSHIPELGLTFGNPQVGMYKGEWRIFVTTGYNNVPGTDGVATGSGRGTLYLLDPATGAVKEAITTGKGTAAEPHGTVATPSGLAKISAITADPLHDPVVTYVYGGDNDGRMWRFDLTNATGPITVSLMGDVGPTQPITTRPDVTTCKVNTKVAGILTGTEGKKMVMFGTGRLLDVPDVSNVAVQSVYMLRDSPNTVAMRGTKMVKQTLSDISDGSSLNHYTITNNAVDLTITDGVTSKDGWWVDLNMSQGERVNLDPKIVSGTAIVVTNIPSSSSACSVGGSANVYELNVCTGGFLTNGADKISGVTVAGRTLSANSAAVGFILIRLPTGVLKIITTTADGKTLTDDAPPGPSKDTIKSGWRQIKD
ncbi:MAG: PilC/PilY family type IV pilus protein [Pseudomonadota bacterium]